MRIVRTSERPVVESRESSSYRSNGDEAKRLSTFNSLSAHATSLLDRIYRPVRGQTLSTRSVETQLYAG